MNPHYTHKKKIVNSVMTDYAIAVAEKLSWELTDEELAQELQPKTLAQYIKSDVMNDYFFGGNLDGLDCAEILISFLHDEDFFDFNWPASGGNVQEYLMMGALDAMKKYLSWVVIEEFGSLVEEAYRELRTRYRRDYEDDISEEEAYATRGGDPDRERFTSD